MRLQLFLAIALVCNMGWSEEKKEEAKPENNPAFHEKLLEIAKHYTQYGRVDDTIRWAPYLCKTPSPSHARMSGSKEESSHGRKLYFLFAKNNTEYVHLKNVKAENTTPLTISNGQVLVKESWIPEEVKPGEKLPAAIFRDVDITTDVEVPDMDPRAEAPNKKPDPNKKTEPSPKHLPEHFLPVAKVNGTKYKTGDKKGLFIMYKMAPETPDTDKGWVYGTVTPDGKTVTSSGRVQSCMQCHESAPYERLFGLVPVQADKKD